MVNKALNEFIAKTLSKSDTNMEKLLAQFCNTLLSDLNEARKEIQLKIAWIYEKYGDDVDMQTMQQKSRLINLDRQIAGEIEALTKDNLKAITTCIEGFYSESFMYTGYALEMGIKADLGFGILNPKTIQAAVLNPMDKIKWPDALKANAENYANRISQEVRRGLITGQGYAKTAGKVTELTTKHANKTFRIVRTESHRVHNLGRIMGYEEGESAAEDLGFTTKRIWVATLDNKTRDSHAEMDGQEANENDMFVLPSGVETMGPGLSGIAEEDINCRCTTRLEIVGMEPSARKDNISKKIVPYKPFEEWKKGKEQ
ncbi:MAG TPA: phage minor head protein [Ignavibacteriales bacterium]|nr:phage minor head protein [Ignavibacteriales bacterium]